MKLQTGKLLVTGAALFITSLSLQADEVLSPAAVAKDIAIENLHQDGPLLRGTVVNRSEHRIEDVELSITYYWRWVNETKPGSNSPAWATAVNLPESIGPGEKLDFTYTPEQSIAARNDGSFNPAATVLGYSEFHEHDSSMTSR